MAKTETERHSLYSGRVQIDFYPKSHRYKLISIDDKEYGTWIPSPSSINKKLNKADVLVPWAVGLTIDKVQELMGEANNFTRDDIESMLSVAKTAHSDKTQDQADVGSIVHHYAEHGEMSEDYDKLSDEDKSRADNGIKSFDEWKKTTLPVILKTEFLVFSLKQLYVGTADGLAEINGKKYLIDYKTSKGVYSDHVYQVSAYLKAYEEEYGEKLEGAIVIHFRKDDVYDKEGNLIYEAGTFGMKTLSRGELVKAFKGFKALQSVYEVDKEIIKIIKKS